MSSSSPKSVDGIAFILQVKVTFDPKDSETFLKHFEPCYEAVLAEPECAFFLVGQDIQTPGVFSWTEGWTKDVGWFMSTQIKKPYYEPYLRATEPLFTSPRVATVSVPLDGLNHVKTGFLKE